MNNIYIDIGAVFFPLVGAILASVGCCRHDDRFAQIASCAAVSLAAVLSCFIFKDVALDGAVRTHVLATWIEAGSFKADWALRLDTLSVIMLLVVNIISAMVHIYAISYMQHERGIPRFMAYLSLFTFFMLMLVSADNLLQMFFGWEGVGLASYLLIGFWFERPRACAAAMKAFWVNRVGDVGFVLGIFGCYQLFGSLQFDDIFRNIPQLSNTMVVFGETSCSALTLITMLLFVGAMGKSAQIGLHTWLPDAMEGPTPVSALIHAATMVTAGVFMLARLSAMFEYAPTTLTVVTVVGAITAFVAATMAMTQFDIKRVIAYSTMSQLGYMFFAAGVSAYGASIFHLMTHAFFKALLFLAAGSVIHAMAGEQDMRKMGGLWRKIPITYALMWIGSLALAGIGIEGMFGFAGFYSKDMILEAAFAHGKWQGYLAYALGLMTVFMTAFYSWRLLILTFHGLPCPASKDVVSMAHEAPWIMLSPLVPLALGAIFVGGFTQKWFASGPSGEFWQGSVTVLTKLGQDGGAVHSVPILVQFAPLAMCLMGFIVSWWFYVRKTALPERAVACLGLLYGVVVNKYYFDAFYDRFFVRPLPRLGALLWHKGDEQTIDKLGADGVALIATRLGGEVRRYQTGYLYHYATAMAVGLFLLLGWFLVKGAGI